MKDPLKILLVDSSVYCQFQLNELLKSNSQETMVELAADMAMAEKAITRFHPNLIITEIDQIEGPSGMDLIGWLKTNAQKAKLMVLIHFSLPFFKEACQKNGADYFFDKATEMLAVKKAIDQLYLQMPV